MKLQAKAKVAKEAKSAAKKTEDVPKVSLIIIVSLLIIGFLSLQQVMVMHFTL